eukprot:maker-scaffold56_size446035-snap-gene-2.11 protein:Tk11495 transcript:maker-scaffold56_size446035-snap-gene-2.11-mRNA-1 annotation:"hypothetical protein KGM_05630"
MREGQRSLQDQQERAAAAAAAADHEKRERRHASDEGMVHGDKSHHQIHHHHHHQQLQHEAARRDSLERGMRPMDHRDGSPILNLSKTHGSESPSSEPETRLEEEEDIVSDDDIAVSDKKEDKENNNKDILANGKGNPNAPPPGFPSNLVENMAAMAAAGGQTTGADGQLNSVYGLIGNIQALLKMAVENAKKDERGVSVTKADPKTDHALSKSHPDRAPSSMQEELEEQKKSAQLYLRRFKKEKRYRRKLQEQLEMETKRRVQMEEALKMTSAETLKKITESLQKEMEDKHKREDSDSLGRASTFTADDRRDSHREGSNSPDNPSTPKSQASSMGDEEDSPKASQQYNAKVSSSGNDASNRGSANNNGGSTPPRETPTIGFAKNLFPFNGSSLFSSAN